MGQSPRSRRRRTPLVVVLLATTLSTRSFRAPELVRVSRGPTVGASQRGGDAHYSATGRGHLARWDRVSTAFLDRAGRTFLLRAGWCRESRVESVLDPSPASGTQSEASLSPFPVHYSTGLKDRCRKARRAGISPGERGRSPRVLNPLHDAFLRIPPPSRADVTPCRTRPPSSTIGIDMRKIPLLGATDVP